MKTMLIIFIGIMLLYFNTYSQNFEPGKLWVAINCDEARAIENGFSECIELNNIFDQFTVTSYKQVMGFAKTPHLRNIYEITCECNEEELKNELENLIPYYLEFVHKLYEPIYFYDPEDGAWSDRHSSWHLKKIQADSAWEITIGNPQIRVGVVDQLIDITHPDLYGQIYPHKNPITYDPYTALLDNAFKATHGSPVASFVAAATAEEGESNLSPNGYLASIGFKTKLIAYGPNNLESAVHASTVLNADVVTNSWSFGCYLDEEDILNQVYKESIEEILNNGTVLLAAAGNGCALSCYNDNQLMSNSCAELPHDFEYFSPSYPFHPKYDERIIIVTSTDSLDFHTKYDNENQNITHSHFTDVDVCAPGWDMQGATNTLWDSAGIIVEKQWPYYHLFAGTSFSTPIVAGLCGLIKSVNPCLTPAEVQNILKITADPVVDANSYPGLLGAGRINAYHAVKYAQDNYGYEEYTIGSGQDITWTTEHQAKRITVSGGGRLTIKSTVYMLPGSDIIIERGGELVIDEGYITTCKGLWNGIQVRGRIDEDQYTYSNQGHLTIIHGSTIENALIGAQTIKVDTTGTDPFSTGGIIQAVNANFINCITGVSFMPYENFLNDKRNIKNNLSYLNNCNFKLDTNYNHIFYNPKQFIYMENVRGISIKGCTFSNQIKSKDYEDVTLIDPDKMVGITSLNSSFQINEYCLSQSVPCDSTKPCRFETLSYGIKALNYGSEKYPYINESEFINNKTGIYLCAINNAVITSNYFFSEPVDTANLDPLILGCLYLDNCNAYQVEENIFTANSSPFYSSYPKVGVVVNNSGPYANEIYKNELSYLDYGIIAMNQNKRDSVGLCIKCNNFAYCDYDISVVVDTAINGWGIAEHQGSKDTIPTAPAGNIFTSNFGNHIFDIFNDEDADQFTYFHHYDITYMTPNLEPDFYSQSVNLSLNRQWYDPDESCPSHLGSGGGSSLEKSNLEEAEFEISRIDEMLMAYIDGGNTENLTEEVLNSSPPEAVELSEQLLTESPFLSDTVLKSAIEKEDVLANAMIRDILVENPQSAKNDEIMSLLDERIDPMPEYMKEQIEQGKFTTGEKENLEAKQSYFFSERTRAFNNLNRIYQSDSTVTYRLDSLATLFNEMTTLENQYRKAIIHLENGDTTNATSTLNSIPNNFELTIEQSNTHQKYVALSNILKCLQHNIVSVLNLDSAQIAGLLAITNNETLPGIYARNLLLIAGYLTYKEPYLFPDNLKKMEIKPVSARKNNIEPVSLYIYPNPAKYYAVIGFDINEDESIPNLDPQVQINIYDLLGDLLKTLKSNQKSDQLVLDVRDLKSGIYLLDLHRNGKRISTSKLIVNR